MERQRRKLKTAPVFFSVVVVIMLAVMVDGSGATAKLTLILQNGVPKFPHFLAPFTRQSIFFRRGINYALTHLEAIGVGAERGRGRGWGA